MNLEDKLIALLAQDDLRPLVRALCACARRQLPRAEQIDPFNVTIVQTAESWAAGTLEANELREVSARAGATRGASLTSVGLQVIAGPKAEREQAVRFFARQIPTMVWFASNAGQQWQKKAGPFAQVGQDPKATAQIAIVQDELIALVEKVFGTPETSSM